MKHFAATTVLGLGLITVILTGCGEKVAPLSLKESAPPKESLAKGEDQSSTTELLETSPILIDGMSSEWSAIRRFTSEPSPSSIYGPTSLKVARKDESLFLLFNLRIGIRERLEDQKRSGELSSGAIGYVDFEVDGRPYRIWIPTGYSLARDADPSKAMLAISYEVHGEKDGDLSFPQHELVFRERWEENSDYIAFKDRSLELLIPLKKLGISSDALVSVTAWSPF